MGYARKDIIYSFGGIYLDMDVEVFKPLDNLL
ncbi:glycosyltransferase [Lachnospiraceae bacterium 48-21]